jgi:conjugal transfer pilus assembly protein TraU
VRKPFCLVSLGGIDLDPGIPAPEAARFHAPGRRWRRRQLLPGALLREPGPVLAGGGDRLPLPGAGSFDLAYLTEVDPLWNDDELTLILNPDAVLFANPVAIAACAADCVAASSASASTRDVLVRRLPGRHLPLDGHVPYHLGGVRTAALMAQRLTAKMHRELLAWGWHGKPGPVRPVLRAGDGQDRLQDPAHLPIPNTDKDGGRCCQPFGRTTVLWGAGKEYPVRGEDFAFMLFRKRNCCVGY